MRITAKFAAFLVISMGGSAFGNRAVTSDDLRQHNSETDCWMAIDGSVYDMSPYLKLHRETCMETNFSEYCGKDASAVWKEKETGKSPHKKKSQRGLLKSKIGTLAYEKKSER